ncbi:Na+/H+ antiporter NhaA [Acidithiobacillus thiooxidans]|jgi:NhaA family Na+:H+ antiporter|uniref:Na+/H+ antiporter NhaA n=1 Tax=Acidithiobacillus thiooxidans TaxID=930 RepID=UPI001C07069D|nr:Na+/H+ antiporter NhaA [Acidithiobacillus thiooxidans]MBU2841644.1 Na+/H+ antiporter NhaA [Acidithiobacillus thiooxidans]
MADSESRQTHYYPLELLFGKVFSPFEQFLRRATAGGIILIVATLLTLFLSNSPWHQSYHLFWENHFGIHWGHWILDHSLHHWINDGLMVVFFFVVGLELKREFLVGELSSLRDATLPIIAAGGGMLVPALIYHQINPSGPAAEGWGIPMATDIAFAIGILVLLAWRIPRNLIVFLTALAIADDLGAVLVIAIFYTPSLDVSALIIASLILLGLILLNQSGVRKVLPYLILGLPFWYFVMLSGIHATVAGILLAFTIPARGRVRPDQLADTLSARSENLRDTIIHSKRLDPLVNGKLAGIIQSIEHSSAEAIAPQQHLEHRLQPWVTFAVIPIFALANAGINFAHISIEMLLSRVTLGIFLGLVLGKFVGISLASWLAIKIRMARMPSGVSWPHLLGAAGLAGVGFTMSLFISDLAFKDALLVEEAKLGILLASLTAACAGLIWLFWVGSKTKELE